VGVMAKRRRAKSQHSGSHVTRNKAPSGSRMLRDERGQFEMERGAANRIEQSRERHLEAERERIRALTDEELLAEHERIRQQTGEVDAALAKIDAELDRRKVDARTLAAMRRVDERLNARGLTADDTDNREVAMTIAEEILDDLVQNGFDYGDIVDDRLERRGQRYRHYDGPTGRLASETTIETTARELFPQAFVSHHPYERWEDAMIEQVRLHEWTGTYTGRRYMDDFEAESNSKHVEGAQLPPGFMHMLQMHTLLEAEPVWIAPEMVDLIAHARETWPGEKVLGSDAFVPTGFCLLSRPIELFDGPPNDTVWIRAIAWMAVIGDAQNRPGAPGSFWISLYGHADDQELPPGTFIGDAVGQKLRLVHIFQWTWGTTPVDPEFRFSLDNDATGDDERIIYRRAHDQSRTVQTLWRLASQLVPVKYRAPRQLRRDAKRKLKRNLSDVNVITLRRERSTEKGEETGRHVTVTSLVSGYWGTRHYREGPRKVWVAPYLRGQGPFKESKRAWEWKR
jgi:hypothetical protein